MARGRLSRITSRYASRHTTEQEQCRPEET